MTDFYITFYLIRHGETFDNASISSELGKSPWDWSPKGWEQCRYLGREIKQQINLADG